MINSVMSTVYTEDLVIKYASEAASGKNTIQAYNWLGEFQKSRQAWSLVQGILGKYVNGQISMQDEALFHVLHTISHQMQAGYPVAAGVLQPAKMSLLDMLRGSIPRMSKVNLRRLTIALSAAAIHDETWDNPIADFVNTFSSNSSDYLALAELLGALPEELQNQFVAVTPGRREEATIKYLPQSPVAFDALYHILDNLTSTNNGQPMSPNQIEVANSVLRAANAWLEIIGSAGVSPNSYAHLIPGGPMKLLCILADSPLIPKVVELALVPQLQQSAVALLTDLTPTTHLGLPNALIRAFNFLVSAAKISTQIRNSLNEMGGTLSIMKQPHLVNKVERGAQPFLSFVEGLSKHSLTQLFMMAKDYPPLNLPVWVLLDQMGDQEELREGASHANSHHHHHHPMGIFEKSITFPRDNTSLTSGEYRIADESVRAEAVGAINNVCELTLELLVCLKGTTGGEAALDVWFTMMSSLLERVRACDDSDYEEACDDENLMSENVLERKRIQEIFKPMLGALAERIVQLMQYETEVMQVNENEAAHEIDSDEFEARGNFRNHCSSTLGDALMIINGEHTFMEFILNNLQQILNRFASDSSAATDKAVLCNLEAYIFVFTTLIPRATSKSFHSVNSERHTLICQKILEMKQKLIQIPFPPHNTTGAIILRAAVVRLLRWGAPVLRYFQPHTSDISQFRAQQLQAASPLIEFAVASLPVFSETEVSRLQCEPMRWDGESAATDSLSSLLHEVSHAVMSNEEFYQSLFNNVFPAVFRCNKGFVESRVEVLKLAGSFIAKNSEPSMRLTLHRSLVTYFLNEVTSVSATLTSSRPKDPVNGKRHSPDGFIARFRLLFAAINCIQVSSTSSSNSSSNSQQSISTIPSPLVILEEFWPQLEAAMITGCQSEICIDSAVNSLNGICSIHRTLCVVSETNTSWVQKYINLLPTMFNEWPNVFVLGAVRTLIAIFAPFPIKSLSESLAQLVFRVASPVFTRVANDSLNAPPNTSLFGTCSSESMSQWLTRPNCLLADMPDLIGMTVDCINMSLVNAPLARAILCFPIEMSSSPTLSLIQVYKTTAPDLVDYNNQTDNPTGPNSSTTVAAEALRAVALLLEGCDHPKVLAASALYLSRLFSWISIPPSSLRIRPAFSVLPDSPLEIFRAAAEACAGAWNLLNGSPDGIAPTGNLTDSGCILGGLTQTNPRIGAVCVWPLHRRSELSSSVSGIVNALGLFNPDATWKGAVLQDVAYRAGSVRVVSRLMYLCVKMLCTSSVASNCIPLGHVAFMHWLHPSAEVIENDLLRSHIVSAEDAEEIERILPSMANFEYFKLMNIIDLVRMVVEGIPESHLSPEQKEKFIRQITGIVDNKSKNSGNNIRNCTCTQGSTSTGLTLGITSRDSCVVHSNLFNSNFKRVDEREIGKLLTTMVEESSAQRKKTAMKD